MSLSKNSSSKILAENTYSQFCIENTSIIIISMLEVMFLPKCKVNERSDFAFFLNKEDFIPLCISPKKKKTTKTEPTNGSKEQSFLALWDMQKHVLQKHSYVLKMY